MLRIENFELQGSEGSGNFGHPIEAEDIKCIKKMLPQLPILNKISGGSSAGSPTGSVSSVQSQAGSSRDPLSSDELETATQQAIATQAPRSHFKRSNVDKHNSKTSISKTQAGLLALLGSKHSEIIQPSTNGYGPVFIEHTPGIDVSSGSTGGGSFTGGEIVVKASVTKHQSRPESEIISTTTRPQSMVDKLPAQSSPLGDSTTNVTVVEERSADLDSSMLGSHKYTVLEKVNRQEGRNYSIKPVESTPIVQRVRQTQSTTSCNREDDNSLWEGLSRIPRKYVQIDKHQHVLLERDEAWYAPPPGNKAGGISVPSKVLLDLQAFHGREPSDEPDADDESDASVEDESDGTKADTGSEAEMELLKVPEEILLVEDGGQDQLLSSQHTGEANPTLPNDGYQASAKHSLPPPRASHAENRVMLGDPFDADSNESHLDGYLNTQIASSPNKSQHEESHEVLRWEEDLKSEPEAPSVLDRNQPHTNEVLETEKVSKLDIETPSPCPSSSPVEMEILVPLALNSQLEPTDHDVVMSDIADATEPTLSIIENQQFKLQVERTPHSGATIRLPLPLPGDPPQSQLYNSTQPNLLRKQKENLSSDPIIPATFNGESLEESYVLAEHRSLSVLDSQLDTYMTEAQRVISTTSTSSTQVDVYASSPPFRTATDVAHDQLQTEQAESSQTIGIPVIVTSGAGLSKSSFLGSEVSSFQGMPSNQGSIKPSTTSTTTKNVSVSVLGTPTISTHPERLLNKLEVDASLTNRLNPLKRTLSSASETSEHSPKRRRSVQAALFSGGQEEETAFDPMEMAKANRRNFLQQISLKQDASNKDVDQPDAEALVEPQTISDLQAVKAAMVDEPLKAVIGVPSSETAKLEELSLFDKYKATYPSYQGSKNAFISACVYIEVLQTQKKAPHPILWDDFIRAFKMDYAPYVGNCRASGQVPLDGLEYYNTHVLEPAYNERVVTPSKLSEALLIDPDQTSQDLEQFQISSRPHDKRKSRSLASSQDVVPNISVPSQPTQITPSPTTYASMEIDASGPSEMTHGGPDEMERIPLVTIKNSLVKKRFFKTHSQVIAEKCHVTVDLSAPDIAQFSSRPNTTSIIDEAQAVDTGAEQLQEPYVELKDSAGDLEFNSGQLNPPVEPHIPDDQQTTAHHSEYSPPRGGSPILGSMIVEPVSAVDRPERLGSSLISKPSLQSAKTTVFGTPPVPASKTLKRRTKSMPGPASNPLDRRSDVVPSTVGAMRTRNPVTSPPAMTFREFARNFVPRRKRMSDASRRTSISDSIGSSSVGKIPNSLVSAPAKEPETQVWTF